MSNLSYFNPEFSTERMNESSPFNTMVMVDGFIYPIKSLPAEMQEIVKRERALGRDVESTTEPE